LPDKDSSNANKSESGIVQLRLRKVNMDYQTLKTRQRAERGGHDPNLILRVHRALSWLNRAEQTADDLDGGFIFLWISFNAANREPVISL
jgi:hypothetical protein